MEVVSSFLLLTASANTRAALRASARSQKSIRQISGLFQRTIERIERSRRQIRRSDEIIAACASIWGGSGPESCTGLLSACHTGFSDVACHRLCQLRINLIGDGHYVSEK